MLQCKNLRHFFAAIAKQRLPNPSGVIMVQRVVYVPFSSMRSVLNSPEEAPFHLEPAGKASQTGSSPHSVPSPRFAAMPEQDLTIWSAGLLFEALIDATRELLRPSELRFAQVRKRDRA
jgi:hypothetical protein